VPDEARHAPDVRRSYEGAGIVVRWEPKLCIHVANCIRALPAVFNPGARPWVDVDAATAAEIAEAIRSCPTGALAFDRTDGGPQEMPDVPTTVQPRLNGPLFLRGDIQVVDTRGAVTRSATRMALCRCGHSQNKPYCDLSHRAAGFRAEPGALPAVAAPVAVAG
jgi:uncharacterized Fe-S cluster protein YjdI/CDGSH-type Zn-finger protein